MRIHGHSDAVEKVQNQRLVSRSAKGIPSTFRWLTTSRADHTEVTLEVDYEVPALLRLAERMVGRVNEREAETLLNNLKRKLEA
jgi:uncharacterized membrane protein